MNTAVFPDLDGVICDSALEWLASSWLAYYRSLRRRAPEAAPLSLWERFSRLRPFARSAPDYVLIQELIDSGKEPAGQAELDRERSARRDRLGRYTRAMQAARCSVMMCPSRA